MRLAKSACFLALLSAGVTTSHAFEIVNVPQAYAQETPSPSADSGSPGFQSRAHEFKDEAEALRAERAESRPVPVNLRNVQQVGSGTVVDTQSFGDRVPFPIAVEMMLPDGWGVQMSGDAGRQDYLVSWQQHRPWTSVLSDFVSGHPSNPEAVVNWSTRTITVSDIKRTVAGNTQWRAVEGRTLKRTLEDWASADGWSVVWDLKRDFVLGANANFNGNLSGAIDQLFLSTATVNREIAVEMYSGNNVIRVLERKGAQL